MRSSRNSAFTLVELLVVIGIIAILISVLMPALSRARQQAVSAQCLSNLRQVGQACVMYANENHGFFPPSKGDYLARMKFWGAGSDDDKKVTVYAMAKYAKNQVKIFYCPAHTFPKNQNKTGIWSDPPSAADYFLPGTDLAGTPTAWLGYWWVTAPYFDSNLSGKTQDQVANNYFYVRDDATGLFKSVAGNYSKPCRPGIEYLRKIGDKNSAKVAIVVDQSRQDSVDRFFLMHGSGKRGPDGSQKGGWKNELYGDGHSDMVRGDEIQSHWGQPPNQLCAW